MQTIGLVWAAWTSALLTARKHTHKSAPAERNRLLKLLNNGGSKWASDTHLKRASGLAPFIYFVTLICPGFCRYCENVAAQRELS